MFYHVKELQFNARVSGPYPRFATLLLEQFGGGNGELKAAMQYFIQTYGARQPYTDNQEPALRSNRPGAFEAAALDEDTLLLRLWGPQGDSLLAVVRLRGSGMVSLEGRDGLGLPAGMGWDCILTTEDPSFAPDPTPPVVELRAPAPVIRFCRPAAVILALRSPLRGVGS